MRLPRGRGPERLAEGESLEASQSLYDKVMNVQNGGGSAALIFNNEPGALNATLGDPGRDNFYG